MQAICKNLKRLRKAKGLTQEELAARLHVTRQAVSNWERGTNLPDLALLSELAQALEADVTELLYGPQPKAGELSPAEKRRRIVTAAVLWGVCAVLFLMVFGWKDEVHAAYVRARHTVFTTIYGCLLRPMAYLCLGMAVPAFVSIWRDLGPADRRIRWLLLGLGVGILLLMAAVLLIPWYTGRFIWVWYQLWTSPAPFLVSGALLFCGWRRKAG